MDKIDKVVVLVEEGYYQREVIAMHLQRSEFQCLVA